MLHILVILIILIHFCLCFKSLAYGCAFYIAVKMIIPTPTRVAGLSLYTFMLVILIFFAMVRHMVWRKDKKNAKAATFPFVYLIFPIAILGLFGVVDYSFQYRSLIQFALTEVSPFFLLMIAIKNEDELRLCVKTLSISYLIIGVWGIVTYITHINLYVLLFANAFDYSGELYVGNGEEMLRGVLSSSASGNQSEGAIPWGQISLVMLTFGLFYQKIDNKILKNSFIILAVLNCFLSTKRSVIVPMLLLLGYMFVNKGIFTRKNLIRGIGFVIIGIVLYINVPVVRDVYHSNIETALFFWDDDLAAEHDFKGSNKSMRMSQAIYVNNLISDHFFAGLGYGYPIVHNMKYHVATDALYFESLYLDTISSSGYIGFLVWIFFFFLLIKKTNFACRNKLDNYSLHGGYILSVFLTNIYCSFAYYMIVIALFVKYKQLYGYSCYRPLYFVKKTKPK